MKFTIDEIKLMRDSMVSIILKGGYSKQGYNNAMPLIDKIDNFLDVDHDGTPKPNTRGNDGIF